MATHKVPTDVETADKLVGFLNLKQFIFVLVGFGLGFIAFNLAKANFILAIPFLPFIFICFVLGLYQRKDQPVEVFLAAWLKYKLSPKARVWNQEGYEQHLIVTAPKKEQIDYTKGMTAQDVYNRSLSLGSNLDTGGWATRGVSNASATQLLKEPVSESLIDEGTLNEIKKKYAYQPPQEEDVFDANNYPVATRAETGLDHLNQAQTTLAQNLITNPTAQNYPSQPPVELPPTATTKLEQLATAPLPITTISEQAAQTIDLTKGAEFEIN
jgi:hypothetical protein